MLAYIDLQRRSGFPFPFHSSHPQNYWIPLPYYYCPLIYLLLTRLKRLYPCGKFRKFVDIVKLCTCVGGTWQIELTEGWNWSYDGELSTIHNKIYHSFHCQMFLLRSSLTVCTNATWTPSQVGRARSWPRQDQGRQTLFDRYDSSVHRLSITLEKMWGCEFSPYFENMRGTLTATQRHKVEERPKAIILMVLSFYLEK